MALSNTAKIGISLSAIAAAAASAYYLSGSKGQKRRKHINVSVARARREITRQVKKLGRIDRESYFRLVDKAAQAYQKLRDADLMSADDLRSELKRYWKELKQPFEAKKLPRSAR